jgi:hypothetical protein
MREEYCNRPYEGGRSFETSVFSRLYVAVPKKTWNFENLEFLLIGLLFICIAMGEKHFNAELVCTYSVVLVLDRVSHFVNVVESFTHAMCNTIISTDIVATALILIISNWKGGWKKLRSLVTYTGVFFKFFNFYPLWLLRHPIKNTQSYVRSVSLLSISPFS